MASKVLEILGGAVAPVIANLGKEQFVALLDKFHDKKPKEYATSIVSFYPVVDVHFEEFASESKTKLDDPFVKALKEAIEESAAKYGVELPNLDQD